MAAFVIEGGHKLHGSITPQGAKNEALQVICATLLTSEEVVINNIPDILDVNNLIELLRAPRPLQDIFFKNRAIDTFDILALHPRAIREKPGSR